MEKKTNENAHDNTNSLWGWLFIIFVFIIIWWKSQTSKKQKEPYITTRKAFAKLYDVDLKTFNKWVRLFSDPAILSYNTFAKQRGVTQKQHDYLLALFGSPTEDKPKYSKAQIVALDDDVFHHTEYRSGRESLKLFFDKYKISLEIYAQLNFFPPLIGREIKQQMGC